MLSGQVDEGALERVVAEVGRRAALDLEDLPDHLGPDRFEQFESEPLDSRICAVDGGSRQLFDARSFIVGVFRAASVWTDPSEEEVTTLEPLFADRENVSTIYTERYRKVMDAAPVREQKDLDLVLHRMRVLAEWEASNAAVEKMKTGDILMIDGALVPEMTTPYELLRQCVNFAREKGVDVVGVSKGSGSSVDGIPLVPSVRRVGDEHHKGRWAYECLDSLKGMGTSYIVRFHPSSEYCFRTDIASDDPTSVIRKLSTLCNDAIYIGYPYPLARAHNLAVVDRMTTEHIRSKMREKALLNGLTPAEWDALFRDFHGVLDANV